MDEENSHCEEDGIMKAEGQQETAINLSTSKDQHLRACNGDVRSAIHSSSLAAVHAIENGDTCQGQVKTHVPPSLPTKSSPISTPLSITGAAKRKAKAVTESSLSSSLTLQQQLAQVQAQQQQQQQQHHQQQQQQQQQQVAAAAAAAAAAAQQAPLIMLAAQQGLNPQQMQQLLQQQLLNPQQLQQVMQQQTLLLQQQQQQKLQEQLLHQLNEQLQMNILQQSQLLQQQQQIAQSPQSGSVHSQINSSDKNKNNKQVKQRMQELTLQQQQLIQQIQLQQRQYLLSQGIGLVPPFGLPQAMSPAEIQQLWKEVATQSGIDSSVDMKNHLNGVALATSVAQAAAVAAASVTSGSMNPLLQSSSYLTNGIPDGYLLSGGLGGGLLSQPSLSIKQEQENSNLTHPLYRHGLCKWPGCDTPSEDFPSFIKHLNSEHQLDDRSTAQARVQMQVVSQLEIQLTREKELLQAMMQHLHMKPPSDKPDIILPILPKQQQQQQQQTQVALQQAQLALASQLPTIPLSNPVTLVSTPAISMSPTTTTSTTTAVVTGTHPSPSPVQQSPQQQQASSSVGPIRRRVSDKCNLPISAGMQRDMENAFLSFVEIQRNREFYRTTDVRPPFTYASLIRQAIIESPHRQLTLNEIYQWFTNTFAYFRRNEATWKNAVRHNLSLHKCFMRVENVKGAVWTVDEVEFYKRRPQKMSGNLSLKSPNITQDPSLFGENLNASLRAALGDNNLSLIANGQLTSGPLDGVEDLSMKSHASHLENLSTEPISEEELLLSIKQEPPCETDNMITTPSIIRPSELPMLGHSAGESSLMTPHPSDTAAMMGSNSDTPMLRHHPNDTSLMCSATDVSSSMRSVDTPTMCPASDSSLMCPANDTSMMGESADMYPPSEASGTNDAMNDNENCAVDFSMVDEPATPPPPPLDRLESNLGVPTTPSQIVSHSSDA